MKINPLLLLPLLLTGCGTTSPTGPVTVQISDPSMEENRFRSSERQRDVWISPQSVDEEILAHDQFITFVEKPAHWQIKQTMLPSVTHQPELPNQEGDYLDSMIARQKEMLAETQSKMDSLQQKFEETQKTSAEALETKDSEIKDLSQDLTHHKVELQNLKDQLNALSKAAKEKELKPVPHKKPWWEFWH